MHDEPKLWINNRCFNCAFTLFDKVYSQIVIKMNANIITVTISFTEKSNVFKRCSISRKVNSFLHFMFSSIHWIFVGIQNQFIVCKLREMQN